MVQLCKSSCQGNICHNLIKPCGAHGLPTTWAATHGKDDEGIRVSSNDDRGALIESKTTGSLARY